MKNKKMENFMNKHMIFVLLCSFTFLHCCEEKKALSFYTDKSLKHPIVKHAQETIVSFMNSAFPSTKNIFSSEFIQKQYPSEEELRKKFEIIQQQPQKMDLESILITQPLIKYVPNTLHQALLIKFLEESNSYDDESIDKIKDTLVYVRRK
jgi:hypothetical protein